MGTQEKLFTDGDIIYAKKTNSTNHHTFTKGFITDKKTIKGRHLGKAVGAMVEHTADNIQKNA